MILADLIAGAEAALDRERTRLSTEQAVEIAAQELAKAEKRPLIAPYWQARYRAEQRVRAAEAVLLALKEVTE